MPVPTRRAFLRPKASMTWPVTMRDDKAPMMKMPDASPASLTVASQVWMANWVDHSMSWYIMT